MPHAARDRDRCHRAPALPRLRPWSRTCLRSVTVGRMRHQRDSRRAIRFSIQCALSDARAKELISGLQRGWAPDRGSGLRLGRSAFANFSPRSPPLPASGSTATRAAIERGAQCDRAWAGRPISLQDGDVNRLDAAADVLISIGRANAWGGDWNASARALLSIRDRLRPGGRCCSATRFWERTPSRRAGRARARRAELPLLAGSGGSGADDRFRPLAVRVADNDEWDSSSPVFVPVGETLAARTPGCANAAEVRAVVDQPSQRLVIRVRGYLGFAYLTLEAPACTPRRQGTIAEWCDALCRTHGIAGQFGMDFWSSSRRTPPYYPDAVTLSAPHAG